MGFRRLVETLRPGIRLTPQQNMLFTDIAEEHKPAVGTLLRDHNISSSPTPEMARRGVKQPMPDEKTEVATRSMSDQDAAAASFNTGVCRCSEY